MIIRSIIYITVCIIYYLLIKLMYKSEIKRKWIHVGVFLIFQIINYICTVKGHNAMVFVPFIMAISYFFMVDEILIKRIKIVAITTVLFLLSVEAISTILTVLNLYIVSTKGAVATDIENIQNNLIIIVLLIILTMADVTSGKYKSDEINVTGKKKLMIYVSLIFMVIVMLATITLVQYILPSIDNKKIEKIFNIIAVLSFISLGVIMAVSIYIIGINKKVNSILEQEKLLKDTQKIYYETLLHKEEDTKRFRHDITGHLICIQEMAEESGDTRVTEYVKNLNDYMKKIAGRVYTANNKIIDILMNYYISTLKQGIDIHISGALNEDVGISQTDICTIFGNVLKNAIEELNRCENGALNIKFAIGKQYKKIEIENSIAEEKQGISKWDEEEKKNHGYGLENVREAVEKNHGKIEIKNYGKRFRISIIL